MYLNDLVKLSVVPSWNFQQTASLAEFLQANIFLRQTMDANQGWSGMQWFKYSQCSEHTEIPSGVLTRDSEHSETQQTHAYLRLLHARKKGTSSTIAEWSVAEWQKRSTACGPHITLLAYSCSCFVFSYYSLISRALQFSTVLGETHWLINGPLVRYFLLNRKL